MLILMAGQTCTLGIDPRDAYNNVAELDGPATWSAADTTVFEVVPSENGLTSELRSLGKVGVSQVNVTGDVRMGDEVKMLTGVLDVEVRAGEAATLGITATDVR